MCSGANIPYPGRTTRPYGPACSGFARFVFSVLFILSITSLSVGVHLTLLGHFASPGQLVCPERDHCFRVVRKKNCAIPGRTRVCWPRGTPPRITRLLEYRRAYDPILRGIPLELKPSLPSRKEHSVPWNPGHPARQPGRAARRSPCRHPDGRLCPRDEAEPVTFSG